MIVKVVLPKWGMGIEEGTVTRWLKTTGERVTAGEPIVEVETAKAVQEVEAPASGKLVEILVPAGASTAVNTDLALIEDSDG